MKTAQQHTPGPWTVEPENEGLFVYGLEGNAICKMFVRDNELVTPVDSPDAEMRINARLMAAAPDLLEACKAAERELFDPNRGPSGPATALDTLRAAIARAEGRE